MIGTSSRRIAQFCTAVSMAMLVAGCGGGGDDDGGGAAATPTSQATQVAATATVPPANTATVGATASPTPVQAARISGLLAVRNDVDARSGDALMPLPPEAGGAVGQDFDRALAHADWMVPGTEAEGVTGGDGRFAIEALPPGQHILHVTKTVDGNLMAVDVPFVVGDDGGAEIIAEVGWGLVKATSTYTEDGVEIRVTFAPNGAHMVERDGRIVEFGDYTRTLTDADGDGRFDSSNCTSQPQLSACDNANRTCPDGSVCDCLASCPSCEDCGAMVCAAPSPVGLYRCSVDGSCQQPGDRCVCVPSCPECDDCRFNACVPCAPVDVVSIVVEGNSQLVIGQQGSARATAQLSDGSLVDVTWLADWASSDTAVATVDAWGTIEAIAIGSTDITATFEDVTGTPQALMVVERPTLNRIYLQNTSCYYYLDLPKPDDPSFPGPLPPTRSDILPVPNCGQVVRIGATIGFRALGEFANGYYEDLTDEVVWRVEPAAVGDVVAGLFTARGVGTAQISAALGTVESEDSEIRVVAEASVVSLSIYGGNWAYPVFDGGPVRPGADAPCFECGYGLTILRGDTVHFQATAHYDTGEWADVTDQVTWRSSDTAAATIDSSGVATAVGAGAADIDASLGEVRSSPTALRVVNEATLLNLYIYQEGVNRVLRMGNGDQAVFKAVGNYDVGFQRDVTAEVTWRSSNTAVLTIDPSGLATGAGAGTVQVWAQLGERESERLSLEVFATSDLDYCDATNVNRGTWSDDFNRVVLESDCATYDRPGLVTLRYTVTETQPHGGIFDPCLDLYIYQGEERIRTLREEGCGDPFLANGAPGRDEDTVLKYQLQAFWDLKDERGESVPAGTYTVFGRFYLYYDPIVTIDVTVR